jgi:hypothetical protein
VGVSGTTVKRVERLLRLAPDLLTKVAVGELSAKKALQQAVIHKEPTKKQSQLRHRNDKRVRFDVNGATRRLRDSIRVEWATWPIDLRPNFLRALQLELRDLLYEHTVAVRNAATPPGSPGDDERRTA